MNSKILTAVLLTAAASTGAVQAQEPGSGHPLVSRFEDSTIITSTRPFSWQKSGV